MNAAELYRVLRDDLDPWFKERGFKRHRSAGLGYQRPHSERFLLVWFQCDKWGWDKYAGSSFFVNIAVAASPELWSGRVERLNHYLTDDELTLAREYRNAIALHITPPPESYFEELRLHFARYPSSEKMLQTLRNEFLPQIEPYRRNHDFAYRYFQPSDVIGWAHFIRAPIERAIVQVAGAAQPALAADAPQAARR